MVNVTPNSNKTFNLWLFVLYDYDLIMITSSYAPEFKRILKLLMLKLDYFLFQRNSSNWNLKAFLLVLLNSYNTFRPRNQSIGTNKPTCNCLWLSAVSCKGSRAKLEILVKLVILDNLSSSQVNWVYTNCWIQWQFSQNIVNYAWTVSKYEWLKGQQTLNYYNIVKILMWNSLFDNNSCILF